METLTGEEITRGLWANFRARKPVKLVAVFQGVPLCRDATLVLIGKEYAAFEIQGMQAACIALDKRAYLQSEFLPGVVQARSISVDVLHGDVMLTHFMPSGTQSARRMNLCVQPKEPVQVTVHSGQAPSAGFLADLSVDSQGVYTLGATIAGSGGLERNQSARLEIYLPQVSGKLDLKGRVAALSQERLTALSRCWVEPGRGIELGSAATKKNLVGAPGGVGKLNEFCELALQGFGTG